MKKEDNSVFLEYVNGGVRAEVYIESDKDGVGNVKLDLSTYHYGVALTTVSYNLTNSYLRVEDGDDLLNIKKLGEYLLRISSDPNSIPVK